MINDLNILKWNLTLTDLEILGDWLMPEDVGRDHIAANDNYAWYYVIGQYFKPKKMVEIGVKYGYSIKSLLGGAGDIFVVGYDNEVHRPGSNHIVKKRLTDMGVKHVIYTQSSQDCSTFGNDLDLVHVDGSHAPNDAFHDMVAGWVSLRTGGVLLVDDCYYIPEVQQAFQKFCMENKLISIYLPSFRGLSVVIKCI
jgi:predicted O-methyltransferase YrrM